MVSLEKPPANFANARSAAGCRPPIVPMLAMQAGDTHALGQPNPPPKTLAQENKQPRTGIINSPSSSFHQVLG